MKKIDASNKRRQKSGYPGTRVIKQPGTRVANRVRGKITSAVVTFGVDKCGGKNMGSFKVECKSDTLDITTEIIDTVTVFRIDI